MAFRIAQTLLSGVEQSRPDMMAAGLSANVNCDYVSHSAATAFCDDEGKDRRPGRVGYFVGRPSNQRKSPWASQVKLQLTAAVSDVGLKTGLIDRPKGIKIVAAVIADCESHTSILDCGSKSAESLIGKAMWARHLHQPANFSKIYVEGLARLHPKS